MPKHFTLESCHETGYAWEVDAPETVTVDEIEKITTALVNYTDEPTQETLNNLLKDECFCDDYEIDESQLPIYRKIIIRVRSVHRDPFVQSLFEVKE